MTRVVFRNPGHEGWDQGHEPSAWPARDATVELRHSNSASTFGVARVVRVPDEHHSPSHPRVEPHPARSSAP